MKSVLICLFVPILCLSQTCYFPNYSTSSQYCVANGAGGCQICLNGYQLQNALCYPPCPAGWTQLMPGYCVNSTIINKHQNFTLCPTNQTMELTAGGGEFLCTSYNTGGCQCAPACPSGYLSMGCECIYGSSAAEYQHSDFYLYIFSAIGVLAIVIGAAYLAKRYLIKSEVKIPLQSQANINERYANLVDTK